MFEKVIRPSNSSHETGYETPPDTKLETKVFTKLFRICVLAQFIFLGVSDTKLGYETPMWFFCWDFHIRVSYPDLVSSDTKLV